MGGCAGSRSQVVNVAATVLDVQDNSLGRSPSQQGQLFGLFRRLHNHVDGAGLYTRKKIVENVSGTVTVRSELNVGSTFIVTLPAPEPATA